MRDMIFISHANPEDNEFALWLALQLAKEGYPVWCDLTKLLGGEVFWRDIQEAISTRTAKFLFVLSHNSNAKSGCLDELHCARTVARQNSLKDFIIPLHVDDLPYSEMSIEIARLNAIPFEKGWAGGLGALLAKLEEDGVHRSASFGPRAVTDWWRKEFSAHAGVVNRSERYLSNWFEVQQIPEMIYLHEMRMKSIGRLVLPNGLPYSAYQHGQYAVSFSTADGLSSGFVGGLTLGETRSCASSLFLQGKAGWGIEYRLAQNIVSSLLRACWEKDLERRGLRRYALANGAQCLYFPRQLVDDDTIHFAGADGRKTRRQIVGRKTKKKQDGTSVNRYWHFGIDAKVIFHPLLAYVLRPHVLFSDDGHTIWEGKSRLHAARRSQCSSWWNDKWRDLMLASMSWLTDENMVLRVFAGPETHITVCGKCLPFDSPVSYIDPRQSLQSHDDAHEADLSDEEWILEDAEADCDG